MSYTYIYIYVRITWHGLHHKKLLWEITRNCEWTLKSESDVFNGNAMNGT